MEDHSSFAPAVIVAVGLKQSYVDELQEKCSREQHRLVVAGRQSDLPLSLKCDVAIIATLLPDGDGRRLAREFARTGASVLLVNNTGNVPLSDSWSSGAEVPDSAEGPASWISMLGQHEAVESVSRAGRLMSATRFADAIVSAAAFSGSAGIPASFVRIRPKDIDASGADEVLDRLTSIVGMTTIFFDPPSGERLALVVNGDRRRISKLLDAPTVSSAADIVVVELSPDDDLSSLLGLSLLALWRLNAQNQAPRVLIALGSGQDKIADTLRLVLRKADLAPVYWDAAFSLEEAKSNPPIGIVIDAGADEIDVQDVVSASYRHTPPIPVLAISVESRIDMLGSAMSAGALDFLVSPFEAGEAQAALARVVVIGGETIREKQVATESDPDPVQSEEDVSQESDVEATPPVSSTPEPSPSETVEQALGSLVSERLCDGKTVTLEGIGEFAIEHVTSKIVHDADGRTIVEPPRQAVVFTPVADKES